jgi:hypothetical protein
MRYLSDWAAPGRNVLLVSLPASFIHLRIPFLRFTPQQVGGGNVMMHFVGKVRGEHLYAASCWNSTRVYMKKTSFTL